MEEIWLLRETRWGAVGFFSDNCRTWERNLRLSVMAVGEVPGRAASSTRSVTARGWEEGRDI